MSLTKKLAIIGISLFLSACQSMMPGDKPLVAQRSAWEHVTPGCTGEPCPLVNIDTLSFAEEPQLTALIEHALLRMTTDAPDSPLPASLQAYEKDFLARADSGWKTYLQAKLREQHDQLVIIELSSYLATGGAHGMPGRGFINYDRDLHKALTLRDMLKPGTEDTFWQAAEQAHQRWLKANKLDQDPEYLKNWPFTRTANIALLKKSVLLKYDVYTLAPYSSGHVSLTIPYSQLRAILKPEYLPAEQ
ncbi:RsiV family protein [Pseudomonas sp. EL_65y_Pfl2_R95]|uniref:RsiV family protein n=1 Tax=Pseudomonas sp. EL_65y_Pfl2_R95 TaxID=3088698 RepID=UPI0030DA1482